jgi:hypothetical protein
MTYTIAYNSSQSVIEVSVQGDLTSKMVKEIAFKVMRVSKEQNCYFILSDLRHATIKLSTTELVEGPFVRYQLLLPIAAK